MAMQNVFLSSLGLHLEKIIIMISYAKLHMVYLLHLYYTYALVTLLQNNN